ncbi:hypothetical protein KCU65_g6505, partial [Aureobasidium melanogenum]
MDHLYRFNGFDQTILQRQYGHIKDMSWSLLIGSRVKVMTLESNREQDDWDPRNVPSDTTVDKYLNEYFEKELYSMATDSCLQICFLTLDVDSTRDQTYKGRRTPSRSKIQYLVHLNDCRGLAIADLKHAKAIIDGLKATVESDKFCCQNIRDPVKISALKTFSDFQNDIEFLVGKFEGLELDITLAKEQIKEQMDLAQGQRTLILTIAAAFFIPLSFVASIYGMNVTDPLFPPLKTNLASTIASASNVTPSSTLASGPSQHYWTMSSYLKLALSLTAAVILLPLIAGPCYRGMSQQSETFTQQWRTLYMVYVCTGYVPGFEVLADTQKQRVQQSPTQGLADVLNILLQDRQVHRYGQV